MVKLIDIKRKLEDFLLRKRVAESESTITAGAMVPDDLAAEPLILCETGEHTVEFDTAARIDQVTYVPLKKGTTLADMEAMGLAVEDPGGEETGSFRSTTATENFFADLVVPEEEDELAWIAPRPAEQSLHELALSDF